jgi:dUTP diphosphatase
MRYFYNGDLDWKVFRADDGSAGVDLINNGETVVIEPNGGTAVLGTGVHVEIPVGYWGLLAARSSLGFKSTTLLTNSIGVIDSTYRGEIKARLINLGDTPVTIERGERFCQLIITNCYLGNWHSVDKLDDLSETVRGQGGFGSSGRK